MRIVSIITAILVMTALYFIVFERDRLLEIAYGGQAPQTAAAPAGAGADAGAENAAAATQAQTGDAADAEELISVVALPSVARDIQSAVLVRGRTEAARAVDVRSETTSQVVSETLRKGAAIVKGQILCQLDPGTRYSSLTEAKARLTEAEARLPEAEARLPEAQARLAEANARLSEARINLNAAKSLSQDGFASETRVAAAEAAYESALAAVESAKAGVAVANSGVQAAQAGVQAATAAVDAAQREIDRLTIRAPFAGLLESDAAETGSLLQAGALCATVIQLDPIRLVGFIPEGDVDKVRVGVMAGARLATGKQVSGPVTFLSRSADQATRTFRVEVTVSNGDLDTRDGQTAEIIIAADGQLAHLLPLSALTLDDEGRLGVRVVDATGHVRFMPVQVLRDTVDGVWVTNLPEHVDVIVVGQEYVTDGVPVRVAYREATQ